MVQFDNNQEQLKLKIPDYDFAPEFVENANNGISEIIIGDSQSLISSNSSI